MSDYLYSIGRAAKMLGISARTLYRWEKAGRFDVARTASGHCRFSDHDIRELRVFVSKRLAADFAVLGDSVVSGPQSGEPKD